MTAVALGPAAVARRAPRPLPVPLVLALQEGRRTVLHPLALLGAASAVALIAIVGDNGTRDSFEVVSTGPTFFYGVAVYFAANQVASRDTRSGTGELLAAAPVPLVPRVAGLCLAALVPALLCAALVFGADAVQSARGLYDVAPGPWHLAQAPITVLGGALLGTMVARLTRLPGVALLVMLAMVVADAWLNSRLETFGLIATYVSWAEYGPASDWAGMVGGSAGWHCAYLACLCAMAAAGAFLREAARTWLVLAVGAVATAGAVLTGLAQLP
jgi:hypothetical protein